MWTDDENIVLAEIDGDESDDGIVWVLHKLN